jgi:hypothetical protein
MIARFGRPEIETFSILHQGVEVVFSRWPQPTKKDHGERALDFVCVGIAEVLHESLVWV